MLPWPIRRNTYVGKLNWKFKGLKLYLQLWNSPASYWICEHFLLTNLYTSNQWHVSSTNFKGSFLLSRPSEHVFQEISRFFNFIFDDVSHLVLWGRGLRKSCSEQNPFAQIISFFSAVWSDFRNICGNLVQVSLVVQFSLKLWRNAKFWNLQETLNWWKKRSFKFELWNPNSSFWK